MPAPARTSTEAVVAAARTLVEQDGLEALTMQAVAAEVGVRAPSLYKRVAGRDALIGLVADQVAIEMADELDSVLVGDDPAEDLRLLAAAFRAFARRNPTSYRLLFDPRPGGVSAAVRGRSVEAVRRVAGRLAGAERELLAARMFVAWANGFVAMELAGGFQLGGDVDEAWDFAVDALVRAWERPAAG
ncbi:MAG TPA: WHG domain-containing protein [Nocardioides sp.]|jgi:AcrR family transcriptional regulator|uniref:TetR/AcrR family transcriptional regulator n=1 Tax=Nocardioides sp. TaxID=35761 RepID=UPI002E329D0A|nr:WHG domain-containing protein [Nocardioides sp.]HEX3932399.1 WHG domain-containing protein [Nocardioides sp.]